MRVLVTGASGFIGSALVDRLFRDGHKVGAVAADLRDYERVENLVALAFPDVVIHLAAKTEVALSFDNYREVSEVNYVGTVNLAEACRRFAPNLKLFCMASTMETYGQQPPGQPFTEETPQFPMAPYSVAKLACERYLAYMAKAYGFPSVILRQTNAYGRRDNDFFVVERIISQMLTSDVCKLGNPRPVRNFLFIDDLVDLYSLMLQRIDDVVGQTFVTGPRNALRIDALAHMIANQIGWNGQIRWHTQPARPGEIYYLESDPAKAKRVLGWKPRVSLSDGLDRTIAMWRERLHASGELSSARAAW